MSFPFKSCNHDFTYSSCDSSSDGDEEMYYCKTNPVKHKTELCKTFSELGYCNYGDRCRFAHGRHELIALPINTHWKQRKCHGFWKNGYCLHGIRCQFGHASVEWEDAAILKGLEAQCSSKCLKNQSKLFKIL